MPRQKPGHQQRPTLACRTLTHVSREECITRDLRSLEERRRFLFFYYGEEEVEPLAVGQLAPTLERTLITRRPRSERGQRTPTRSNGWQRMRDNLHPLVRGFGRAQRSQTLRDRVRLVRGGSTANDSRQS